MSISKYFHYLLPVSGIALFLLTQCAPSPTSSENEETADVTEVSPMAEVSDEVLAMVEDSLPFTLEFVEQSFPGKPALPRLQSYAHGISNEGEILILGGRRQGLHTFEPAPAKNFQPDSSNNFIYVINPQTGDYWHFDVNQLPGELSAPLQSTNQQAYFDRSTGQMYVAGGYGWKADKSDMLTFPTLLRFNLEDMISAVKSGASADNVNSLIQSASDERFAVTGGELFRMGNQFYLVFGQKFTGQYRAFGGTDFEQKYTEEVRVFTLNPNTLEILSYGAQTNTESDHPFHRRDGNIVEDIDPVTAQARLSAFGGVFPPGIIGGYTEPVYINSPGDIAVDRSVNQRFSQYESPVISVYDATTDNPTVHHTFFGGISHYFFHQTADQKAAYDKVSDQGRNDGLPFIADISTFSQSADGSYREVIHPNTIPGQRLLGTSIRFIVNPQLLGKGYAFENGVIQLQNIPQGNRELVGYIYGGIEAEEPLPLIPNQGTGVSNSLFAVYLTHAPSGVIPASRATEAIKNYTALEEN